MSRDLQITRDPEDPTRISWSCTMMMGIGIANPKSCVVLPITPQMRAGIQARADEAGMSFDDYFDMVVEEANNLTRG